MTDFMQPYSFLSSLINGLVLDAVNENGLYCSVPYYGIEEEHIYEVLDTFLEKYPNMSLTWEAERGYWDFEMKETESSLLHKKLCMAEELNDLLKEQQTLLKRIKRIEADMAALEAVQEADDLLRRLS